jgi:phosphatidylglycerol:prolipoprotein diacylglycerol transferase
VAFIEQRSAVRPIPVVFHIGPLQVHTYGVGLAITFWVAYRYLAARLRKAGYPDQWLGGTFVWVVIAAIVGARAVHVVAHLSYYRAQPGEILAVWHGGLSSFGGLALGVPVGFLSARRRCPRLSGLVLADLLAPVLVAAWALGRLLGPQLMVAGGGKPTHQWFGMYYAGQVGRRLPVPIFQALECGAVYVVALLLERFVRRHGGLVGLVTSVATGLWGASRIIDESLWLSHGAGGDAVEVAGLGLVAAGLLGALAVLVRQRQRAQAQQSPDDSPPPLPDGSQGADELPVAAR